MPVGILVLFVGGKLNYRNQRLSSSPLSPFHPGCEGFVTV